MRRFWLIIVALTMASPAAADDVSERIDTGRAAYLKGELAKGASELQRALGEIHARLGDALSRTMPPVPSGWEGDEPQTEGLGSLGGGLSVSRGYTKGSGALNASLILDNPAVGAALAGLQATPTPTMKRFKVGAEDAVLRWDGSTKSGEITVVLGERVLLQIEGSEIDRAELLIEMMKGWNTAAVRRHAGLPQ